MKTKIEWCIASIIFLAAIIELISWRLSQGAPAIISDPGNGYLLDYYPKLMSLTVFLFSLLLVLKLFIFSHCIYTEIVTFIYFIIQIINLAALFLKFGSEFYDCVIYPVFVISIIFITLIKLVRWFSK